MLFIDNQSHLDHGLKAEHLALILARFSERDAFFIETVELPDGFPALDCGLYGPLVGDAPVSESEVTYVTRGDRKGPTRMVSRPLRSSRLMTVT